MADEVKKNDQRGKPEPLSTVGKAETALEKLGVDKISFNYVSPEAKAAARKANPEVEALDDKAKYDAMHGHFWKGEREHLEALGKSFAAIPAEVEAVYERITGGHQVEAHEGAPVTPAHAAPKAGGKTTAK